MPRRGVDTNVLVRLLADDESEQSARARDVFRTQDVFVPVTVVLETEWVLRSRYRLSPAAINGLLSALLTRPNVDLEHATELREAIAAHRDGVDFADALHLHLAAACAAFLTFDRDLIRRADRLTGTPPVMQP